MTMHVRMNLLTGDPARLTKATQYLEETARPEVEAQPGSRGLAVLSNADLGVCVIATYWDSVDAMLASERAVEASRTEVTGLMGGTVSAEQYEVPVFIRQSRPGPGAGVRMTRTEGDPARVSVAVEEFRHSAGPALLDMPGLCSAQFLVDRGTGRCIAVSTWEDMDLMASTRSPVASLRTGLSEVTHARVAGVQEYMLNFSSVREGDNFSLIEREVALWNERDQAGWLALCDLHRLEATAPGGVHLSGREAADAIWDTWNEAFPDNRLTTVSIHADNRGGVYEGRFVGTHSGSLRSPAGDIGPTGRMVDTWFAVVHECDDGKITSTHIYYDQADLLAQLGVPDGPGGLG
jgi:predicted ester cyclase/heme-degrading monooxygenase HmoA